MSDLNVSELPDDTRLPGHQYTLGEMRAMYGWVHRVDCLVHRKLESTETVNEKE